MSSLACTHWGDMKETMREVVHKTINIPKSALKEKCGHLLRCTTRHMWRRISIRPYKGGVFSVALIDKYPTGEVLTCRWPRRISIGRLLTEEYFVEGPVYRTYGSWIEPYCTLLQRLVAEHKRHLWGKVCRDAWGIRSNFFGLFHPRTQKIVD